MTSPGPLSGALLCLAVLLAGCAQEALPSTPNQLPQGDAVPRGGVADDATPRSAVVQAPQWRLGQAWTLDATYTVAPAMAITIVVVEVLSDGTAVLGVTDLDAGRAALFLHWPPLGSIAPRTLGVDVHGQTVELGRFPVRDGDSWQADFRGEAVTWNASVSERGLVTFVATAGGQERVRSLWDPAVGWFRSLDYTFPGSAAPTHSFTLREAHKAWTGPAFRLDWDDLVVAYSSPADPTANPAIQAQVAAGWDTVLVGIFHGGGPGVVGASLVGPSGHAETLGGARTGTPATTLEWVALPAEPGGWRFAMHGLAQQYFLAFEVFVVSEREANLQAVG